MELKERILSFAALMSISSHECYDEERLQALTDGIFDECRTDAVGNHIFVKRCGREGAPKILVDTHFDEIGMLVTDIKEGGFLTVTNVGGVDTRILQAAEVTVYGKEKLYGVVASTPPHLQKPEDAKNLKKIDELYIDTGYTKETLQTLVSVGTPVGFKPKYTELLGGQLAGKGFDNKACAACAVHALASIPREELAGDVYLLLSAHEETVRLGGAVAAAYGIMPDYAIVADVNLGRTPDTPTSETVNMGGGASISLSAITDRRLTKMTCELAEEQGIRYQKCVAATSTGTNTARLVLVGSGIPCVDVGLPLKSMHTYNEVLTLEDAEALAALIGAFVRSKTIAEVYGV